MASDRLSGLAYALTGFAFLAIGDLIVKSAAHAWPGAAFGALRYIFGTIGLAVALGWIEGRRGFSFQNLTLHFARGTAIGVSAACFFSALFFIPIADATAITFLSPMIAALFSAILLKEPAPSAAWIASFFAFIGVIIILRPNLAEAGVAAILPVFGAIGMALVMVLNRKVAGSGSVLQMQFLISAFATPILIIIALVLDKTALMPVGWPTIDVVVKCAIVACTATAAHALIFLGTTKASAGLVAPMTYVQLLVASFAGMLFFDEHPDAFLLAGAALIVGAGLYLWNSQKEPD